MTDSDYKKKKYKIKPTAVKKVDIKWIITIVIWAFVLSVVFSLASTELISGVNIAVAILILGVIIALGIVFDIIGIAVATADETPFHSMSARKHMPAKEAVALIKSAEKVTSFCNDVVGDICGIVSGASGAIIVTYASKAGYNSVIVSLVITGVIASLTIGGKAVGKSFAMSKSNYIVHMVANVIYGYHKINIFHSKKE